MAEESSEPAEELSQSAELAQASADTGLSSKPETEVIENNHPTEAAQFAWSSEDGTFDYDAAPAGLGHSRHRMIVRAGAVAAVIAGAIVVGGGVWMWDHRHSAPHMGSMHRTASAAAANGPVLDGLYEIASDNQHSTANGVAYPSTDVTRYWAFRSLCTPARCVATAAEVSDTNHQVPNYDHDHSVWLWSNGKWSEDPDHNTTPCSDTPNPKLATGTMVRTLAPHPDGTLKGTEIDVINSDSPCGAGVVVKRPLTAKRIGDTPEGVVADPAAAPPDLGAHANQYVAIAVSPGAKLKSAYSGSGEHR